MKNYTLKQIFPNKFKAFKANNSGQISLMFALLLIPLAAFIGGALDFSQKISYTNKLQSTLDSASLAAAKALAKNIKISDKELKKIADIIYAANYVEPSNVNSAPYTLVRTSTSLTLAQKANMTTTFMGLVGTPNLEINVSSVINVRRSDVELVLSLDTTGSMRGAKLKDLKSASKELINTLMDGTTGLESMRIGLVTWSVGVNVKGFKHKKVIAGNNKGKIKCAAARRGNYTDISPLKKPMAVAIYKHPRGSKYDYIGCSNSNIFPLSSNKSKLLKEMDGWNADYHTSSDTGISWGWGMLSPNWNDLWKKKSQPKAYNSGVKKFLVLMTDGANTMRHFDADHESRKLCDAAKSNNIRIYTIAFKAGSKAEKLLKYCATNDDMYINASSGDALKAAFKKIADEVGTFYISG